MNSFLSYDLVNECWYIDGYVVRNITIVDNDNNSIIIRRRLLKLFDKDKTYQFPNLIIKNDSFEKNVNNIIDIDKDHPVYFTKNTRLVIPNNVINLTITENIVTKKLDDFSEKLLKYKNIKFLNGDNYEEISVLCNSSVELNEYGETINNIIGVFRENNVYINFTDADKIIKIMKSNKKFKHYYGILTRKDKLKDILSND